MTIQTMNSLVVSLSAETFSKHRPVLFGDQAFQLIKDVNPEVHTREDPHHV